MTRNHHGNFGLTDRGNNVKVLKILVEAIEAKNQKVDDAYEAAKKKLIEKAKEERKKSK
jgi:hypothetical protein